jgi:DNA-binding XRE family transcriptional regulator
MGIQTITTETGEQLVVLTRRDYDALLAQLGDEQAEDRMTLLLAAESRSDDPLPQPVAQAVLAGDSVLKAIRLWRGVTQVELAKAAGVTQSFLSEMEARNKTGSAATRGKLAKTLEVPPGWLS